MYTLIVFDFQIIVSTFNQKKYILLLVSFVLRFIYYYGSKLMNVNKDATNRNRIIIGTTHLKGYH